MMLVNVFFFLSSPLIFPFLFLVQIILASVDLFFPFLFFVVLSHSLSLVRDLTLIRAFLFLDHFGQHGISTLYFGG